MKLLNEWGTLIFDLGQYSGNPAPYIEMLIRYGEVRSRLLEWVRTHLPPKPEKYIVQVLDFAPSAWEEYWAARSEHPTLERAKEALAYYQAGGRQARILALHLVPNADGER